MSAPAERREKEPLGKKDACTSKVCKYRAHLILQHIDKSLDPCDDFYKYVCHRWQKRHPVPDDSTRIGVFQILRSQLQIDLKHVLEKMPRSSTLTQRATDKALMAYHSCQYSYKQEKSEFQELSIIMINKGIGKWPLLNRHELWDVMKVNLSMTVSDILENVGMRNIFPVSIGRDDKSVDKRVIQMSQAQFPLIGRNELFNYTSKSQSKIVKAYKTLICKAVKLFRAEVTDKQAMEISEGIIMFEAELAKRTIPAEDLRDPLARYKNTTIGELIRRFPEVKWLRILNKKFLRANITITKDEPIILWVDEYFKKTVPFLETANLRNVYNFIVWRFIITTGRIASRKLDDLMFEFLSVNEGFKKPWKLWKKCVRRVSQLMTFAVGRLYIDFKFSAAAKSSIDDLVDAVNGTMVDILNKIKWMDDATRHEALKKLRKMSRKIAYPERIRNDTYLNEFYSKVPAIQENSSFVKFFYRVSQIDDMYTLQSLRKPYNSSEEWGSGPAIVNAFYSPGNNDIRFPAGILQAPFFEHGVPSYINMGSIGVVIGHELSHAFDDHGSQYDADGLLNNWWTPETRKQFLKHADCFVKQYGNISLDGGKLQLNGKNSLGENIADNLGLKAAYMALQSLDMNYAKLPGLEDFTREQLYFISNAIVFCVNMRPEALKNQVLYDPHSPNKYRVNIPMSNVKEFSKAFGCKPSSHMYNRKKCTMW